MSGPEVSNAIDNVLLAGFVEEAREHLQAFSDGLLAIEAGDRDATVINRVFRGVHTIKGCARTLGCVDIGHLSHAGENVLDAVRAGRLEPSPHVIETLFETCDLLIALVEDVEQRAPQGSRMAVLQPLIQRLDAILEGAGAAGRPPSAAPARSSSGESGWPAPGTNLSFEAVADFVIESAENLSAPASPSTSTNAPAVASSRLWRPMRFFSRYDAVGAAALTGSPARYRRTSSASGRTEVQRSHPACRVERSIGGRMRAACSSTSRRVRRFAAE